jgi:hypothetical protein
VTAPPFGILAVFDTPAALLAADRRLREVGLRVLDAYSPYPVDGLPVAGSGALLPGLIAAGGVLGGVCGYAVQYWGAVLDYPLNVGGRPYHSWPAFAVSAFEVALLFAVAAGFFGLWAACRLPRLYHPVMLPAAFARASRDRFVLCVEAADPGYEPGLIRRILERHGAVEIVEVPG